MSIFFKGLRLKLLLLSGIPLLGLFAAGLITILKGSAVADRVGQVASRTLPQMVWGAHAQQSVTNAIRGVNAVFLVSDNPTEKNEQIEKVQSQMHEIRHAIEELEKLEMGPEILVQFKEWKEVTHTFLSMNEALLQKLNAADLQKDDVLKLQNEYLHLEPKKIKNEVFQQGKEFQESVELHGMNRVNDSQQDANQMVKVSLATMIFSFLISIGSVIFFARQILTSLSIVQNDLVSSGGQVSGASSQLSTASQQLSSGSAQSAASLEESVASIQELSSMVKMNTENAVKAFELSKMGREKAHHGSVEIEKLIESMSQINEESHKIQEIITVIDDIAFQTNLLALNAAVEAARAGEQGKGFAVVAEAVRTLAQKSATSAKEIADLIKTSSEKVERGVGIAQTSGPVLKSIVDSIQQISVINDEISTASSEQSKGIEQISSALTQLDQVVQQNAATSEEVAASAEELSSQAVVVQETIRVLTTVMNGSDRNQRAGTDLLAS